MTNVTEFERESRRIDQMIWDAMALTRGETVLFCGFVNDGAWVLRAAEVGLDVAVIEYDDARIAKLARHGDLRVLRGSTTMIPARENSFDVVVAFHYLHEIDPLFHMAVVTEIARVGKRVVIVEPAPPSDMLGKRIAMLYARAKNETGSFENYQPLEYWRKLITVVKAEVAFQQFTFTRAAPRFAIEETVNLILEAMAIEDLPVEYLDELRELARSPDAQLNPLSRFVLIGSAAGEIPRASAGTPFREELPPPADPIAAAAALEAAWPAAMPAAPAAMSTAPAQPALPPQPPVAPAYLAAGSEMPPVLPPPPQPVANAPAAPPAAAPPQPAVAPAAAAAPPVPTPPAAAPPTTGYTPPKYVPPTFVAPAGPPAAAPATAFGLPPAPETPAPGAPAPPFGTPFALPETPEDPFAPKAEAAGKSGFGWSWEPPDDGDDDDDDSFGIPSV